MFDYYSMLRDTLLGIASSSGITSAIAQADSREPLYTLGIDLNDPPKVNEQPVVVLQPCESPIDAGNYDGGFNSDEVNPAFSIEWWFECSTKTVASGITVYDGYQYADSIGRAIGNYVLGHFQGKGYELSTMAYTINQTEQYPTYLGYMVCAVKGIKSLNEDPQFS